MADVDAVKLQMLTEQLAQLNTNLERVVGTAERTTDSIAKRALRNVGDVQKAVDEALGDISDESVEVFTTTFERIGQTVTSRFGDWKAGFKDVFSFQGVDKGISRGAAAATKEVSGGLSALKSSVLAELPFGGLLGLMLYGRFKEAEYAAAGQKVAQQFETAGRVGSDVASKMGGEVRGLSVMLGRDVTADLAAVARSFGEVGDAGTGAMQDASFATDGAHRSLTRTTFALDMLFEVGSGTSAKMAGQFAKDFNADLVKSATLVKDIGLSAGETGMSFTDMVGSIMQATSAMRMFGADAGRSVGDTLVNIVGGFKNMGAGARQAATMGQSALQGVSGAIGGMSKGMLGFLGQEITGMQGTDAIIEMQRRMSGVAGQGQPGGAETFGATIAEILRITRDASGGNERTQQLALQEMFPQMGFEGSQALINIQNEATDQTDLASIAAKNSDRLMDIMKNEALKESVFRRMMKELMDLIARLGGGLLTLMSTGFEAIVDTTLFAAAMIANKGMGMDSVKNLFSQRMVTLAGQSDKGMNDVASAIQGIAKLTGKAIDTTLRPGAADQRSRYRHGVLDSITGERTASPAMQGARATNATMRKMVRGEENLSTADKKQWMALVSRANKAVKAAGLQGDTSKEGRAARQKIISTAISGSEMLQATNGGGVVKFEITAKFQKKGAGTAG